MKTYYLFEVSHTNRIKSLIGTESLLLILPKETANKIDIVNQDWLQYEIKNRELVIKKIEHKERSV